jgi:hypothetical protein
MKNPRILVRPDDFEEFIEVEPGLFSNKKLVEQFPDNLHHKWKYRTLIDEAFALKDTIQVDRYYIDAYPETIYYLPSGSPGYKIMVVEDPYDGVEARLVKE